MRILCDLTFMHFMIDRKKASGLATGNAESQSLPTPVIASHGTVPYVSHVNFLIGWSKHQPVGVSLCGFCTFACGLLVSQNVHVIRACGCVAMSVIPRFAMEIFSSYQRSEYTVVIQS